MEIKRNLREEVDNSKLMTKLSIMGGIGSFILALMVLFLAIAGKFAASDAFALSILPYTLAVIFSFGAFIYSLMATSSAREEEEKRLLEKRKEAKAFNVDEDVRFTAGRSFENYKKFAPYVLAAFGALITFLFLFLFWRHWGLRTIKPIPQEPLLVAFVALIMMVISIFGGAFFIGQSRDRSFRWLHPVGAWMIAGFVSSLLAMLASVLAHFKIPEADFYISRILFTAFVILAIEFVVNFVIEFYRPRTLEEPRPVFESRLLALFTEPGGVVRNVADTLDYQFGFKVSGTWIYRFMEKSLFPMIIGWLAVLWLFSAIQEVGPNEVGVEERFGKIVNEELLEPGIYLTLPYPFGKIARYSCSKIHSVTVGPKMIGKDGKEMRPEIVLWTKKHYAEEIKFLVAIREHSSEEYKKIHGKNDKDEVATSVSFLGVTIPVQYQIKKSGLINYAYKNQDAADTLQKIGQMVATKYFASVDLMDVMSTGRHIASVILKKEIQKEADKLGLGVQIIAVNLLDAHPPVEKVAPAFQNVIGSMEEKESMILKAQAYREKVMPQIEAKKMRLIEEANAYSYKVTKVSKAESERFNKQLQAYSVMPFIYKLRTYLSLLETDAKDIRKFIVSSTLPYEVYELNFEQKQRLDLIDTDLDTITQK
jgi:regulator of protease activity HflC (stomatin/prohibitin superfamily)